MKKLLVLILLGLSIMFVACGNNDKVKIEKVSFHMWGGDDSVNRYIDDWVAPRIKEEYGIELVRVPVNDIKDVLNKLETEKEVDKKKGTVDLIWINGENFKRAKNGGLLYSGYDCDVMNFQNYVDLKAKDIIYDFGEDSTTYEIPWGKAQFVFIYDSAKIETPPKNLGELKEWIKENPGKFTYPAAPDFTGSAFLRQSLIELNGGYDSFKRKLQKGQEINWDYFNDIEQYLWRKGETYPESLGKLDSLFASGEILMSMSYNPFHAVSKIKSKEYPETVKTFVLDGGTLSNTHYLAIPFNSNMKDASVKVIDFLLSPNAQIEKLNPSTWGDGTVLSTDLIPEEDVEKINGLTTHDSMLSQDILEKHRIPELPSEFVEIIEKSWYENVGK